MSNYKHPYFFKIFYFLLLLFFTYLSLGEEFVILSTFFTVIYVVKGKIYIPKENFKYFILYYFIISIIGLVFNNLTIKNLFEFIIRYVFIPFVVYYIIPNSKRDRVYSILQFRNLIVISALYGGIEYILHYNILVKIVRISARNWIDTMNTTVGKYQPSSIFLHYNFYGCFLLLGIIITLIYPYKKKKTSILVLIFLIIQLFLAQSRICWIALSFIFFFHILKRKKMKYISVLRGMLLSFCIILFLCLNLNLSYKIVESIITRFKPIFELGFEYGSFGQRVGTFLNWFSYAKLNLLEALLGTGYGSITNYLEKYSYFPGYSTADCQWTTYLVECGFIGTLCIVLIIIRFWKTSRKNQMCDLSRLGIYTYFILSITFDVAGTSFVFVPLVMLIIISIKKFEDDERNGEISVR